VLLSELSMRWGQGHTSEGWRRRMSLEPRGNSTAKRVPSGKHPTASRFIQRVQTPLRRQMMMQLLMQTCWIQYERLLPSQSLSALLNVVLDVGDCDVLDIGWEAYSSCRVEVRQGGLWLRNLMMILGIATFSRWRTALTTWDNSRHDYCSSCAKAFRWGYGLSQRMLLLHSLYFRWVLHQTLRNTRVLLLRLRIIKVRKIFSESSHSETTTSSDRRTTRQSTPLKHVILNPAARSRSPMCCSLLNGWTRQGVFQLLFQEFVRSLSAYSRSQSWWVMMMMGFIAVLIIL
jgi:hypothetical protein